MLAKNEHGSYGDSCFNCGSGPRTDGSKTFVVKDYAEEKGNNLFFCSNRCRRHTERADKIPRPKLDSSSVLLHTIDAGLDNAITVDFHGCNGKAFEKYERSLTKAILKTSKKTVKPKYTHNEGALPREWR